MFDTRVLQKIFCHKQDLVVSKHYIVLHPCFQKLTTFVYFLQIDFKMTKILKIEMHAVIYIGHFTSHLVIVTKWLKLEAIQNACPGLYMCPKQIFFFLFSKLKKMLSWGKFHFSSAYNRGLPSSRYSARDFLF